LTKVAQATAQSRTSKIELPENPEIGHEANEDQAENSGKLSIIPLLVDLHREMA